MRYIFIIACAFILSLSSAVAQGGYEHIRSDQVRTVNGKKFYVHQVKKGQTLYAISKAYTVPMQEIIDLNPDIKEGLKVNQTLMIPAPELIHTPELFPPADPVLADPPVVAGDDTSGKRIFASNLPCGTRPDSRKEVYNVALMIHLFLKDADSINTESPSQKEIESYASFRYIQFYEGFLLAVDSLKQRGLNLNLYIYSVETNPAATSALLKKPEMKKMDLIVGMLFNRNFEIVASWARDNQIPIVSPVSERESQVDGNPMVIKLKPSYTSEGVTLAEYLESNHRFAHTLLIRSWEEESKTMADQVLDNLRGLNMDVVPVTQDEIPGRLTRGVENVVVIISSQKSFVLNLLSKLNVDTNGYQITVFGLPRWDQFEGMDFQYLEKSHAHILVPSWTDYQDPAVKRFLWLFRERFKTDPENLAFQGYDVAWYFLNALKDYGTGFSDCLMEINTKQLQTLYKFRRQDGSGWENHHWEMFRYDDYDLTPLE